MSRKKPDHPDDTLSDVLGDDLAAELRDRLDSRLPWAVAEMGPAALERLRPEVVVTYPVHGIPGFHDHLVTHAAVKRAWVAARERLGLRRLAFHTVSRETAEASAHFPLSHSEPEEIDVVVPVEERDLATAKRALDCYVTCEETIGRSGIKDLLPERVPFELYDERFEPPLDDLFSSLP